MQWLSDERERFKNAIRELIKQVDECIARDKRTKLGKISCEGTIAQVAKELLSFMTNYQYRLKVGIGNGGGFLNDDSWFIFAPEKIFNSNYINGDKLTPRQGIYIYIAYGGYLENKPYLELSFGFPQADIDNSRCKAVNIMEKQLEKYNHKYKKDDSQLDTIVDDFIEMCKYFDSFEADDFRKENNVSVTDNLHRQDSPQSSRDIPLNQILYGPPGTGKTYHTIDKALEILFAWKEIDSIPQERDEKKKIFNDFISDEQIAFVTFHQSYGYEDFVEGIRPRLNGQKSDTMEYEIKDGIFKDMCQKASENYENYEKSLKNPSEVKREIELDDLLKQYADYVENELQEGKNPKFESKKWTTNMKIQDTHRLQNGDFNSITIGVKGSSYRVWLSQKIIKRDYEKFKSGEIKDWNDIRPSYESKSHRHANAGYYFTLYESIAEFEKTHYQTSTIPTLESTLDNRLKPYILIIDEINRGNISKILGELITLLEHSKRKGEKEALEVTLPYSQEPFSVPKNLYIIGTMNTADRSIALLDTALRRRFEFIEMLPKPSELSANCDGVNLQELLNAINTRIEFLLDRERTIGHAFFIDVKNLNDLQTAFKHKILPLLQEYFYDDYAKIDAVLNKSGILESKTMSQVGISLSDEFVDSEKKVWKITDSSKWAQGEFQKIYDNNAGLNSIDSTESSLGYSDN